MSHSEALFLHTTARLLPLLLLLHLSLSVAIPHRSSKDTRNPLTLDNSRQAVTAAALAADTIAANGAAVPHITPSTLVEPPSQSSGTSSRHLLQFFSANLLQQMRSGSISLQLPADPPEVPAPTPTPTPAPPSPQNPSPPGTPGQPQTPAPPNPNPPPVPEPPVTPAPAPVPDPPQVPEPAPVTPSPAEESPPVPEPESPEVPEPAESVTPSPSEVAKSPEILESPVSSPAVDDTATEEPADPLKPQPEEELPPVVDQSAAAAANTARVAADTIEVSMLMKGVTPQVFNDTYCPKMLDIIAQLSGTSASEWHAEGRVARLQQPGEQISSSSSSSSGRKLLQHSQQQQQQQQQLLYATATILTSNPMLVVYRLSQAPAITSGITAAAAVNDSAAAAAAAVAQGFTGCTTELCSRLVAAGIPLDPNSLQIKPSYEALAGGSSSSGSSSVAAAAATNKDAQLEYTRQLGIIVASSVGGFMVLLTLACNSRRIIDCCARSRCFQPAPAAAAAVDPQQHQQQKQFLISQSIDGSVANKKVLAAAGNSSNSSSSSSMITSVQNAATPETTTAAAAVAAAATAAATAAAATLTNMAPDSVPRGYQPFHEYQSAEAAVLTHQSVTAAPNMPLDYDYPRVSYEK